MNVKFHTIETQLSAFGKRFNILPDYTPALFDPTNDITPSFTTSNQVAHSLNNDNTLTPYRFYTDGSLSNLGTNNIRLGYGWLQLTDDDLIVSEHCNVISSTWPSSTKAELSAVISIIEQLPNGAKVTISLDSRLVIDNIRSIIHSIDHFDKYLLKQPNQHLWAHLRCLIRNKDIVLT